MATSTPLLPFSLAYRNSPPVCLPASAFDLLHTTTSMKDPRMPGLFSDHSPGCSYFWCKATVLTMSRALIILTPCPLWPHFSLLSHVLDALLLLSQVLLLYFCPVWLLVMFLGLLQKYYTFTYLSFYYIPPQLNNALGKDSFHNIVLLILWKFNI